MKKFLKVISILALALITTLSVVACGSNGDSSTEKGLLYKKTDDGYTIYKYVDDGRDSTVLNIADELEEGITNVRIKEGAFSGNNTLTEIVIPDTVTLIDAGAFKNMKKLVKINTPFIGEVYEADAEYGDSANEGKASGSARTFAHWFGTEEYDGGMPITVEYNLNQSETYFVPTTFSEIEVNAKEGYSIPTYAFSGASNLTIVKLNEGIKVIGENAFKGCKNLINLTVPASVTKIAKNAFDGCQSLKAEELFANNSNLEEIGEGAFKNTKFDTLKIPASVKVIANNAFEGSTIKTVYLPKGLEKVGNYAFYNCVKLARVYTDGVSGVEIGVYAFAKCAALDYVGNSANYAQETLNLSSFKSIGSMSFSSIEDKEFSVKGAISSQLENAFYGTNYKVN